MEDVYPLLPQDARSFKLLGTTILQAPGPGEPHTSSALDKENDGSATAMPDKEETVAAQPQQPRGIRVV